MFLVRLVKGLIKGLVLGGLLGYGLAAAGFGVPGAVVAYLAAVVTGVVSWEHCVTCGANDDRPNTGVRITSDYSGAIAWLRQTFP